MTQYFSFGNGEDNELRIWAASRVENHTQPKRQLEKEPSAPIITRWILQAADVMGLTCVTSDKSTG